MPVTLESLRQGDVLLIQTLVQTPLHPVIVNGEVTYQFTPGRMHSNRQRDFSSCEAYLVKLDMENKTITVSLQNRNNTSSKEVGNAVIPFSLIRRLRVKHLRTDVKERLPLAIRFKTRSKFYDGVHADFIDVVLPKG